MSKKAENAGFVGKSLSMAKAAGFHGTGKYSYTRETPTESPHGLGDTRLRQDKRGNLYVVMKGAQGRNIKHILER